MQVNLSNLIAAQSARLTTTQQATRIQTSAPQSDPVAKPAQPERADLLVAPARIGTKIDIRV